MGKWCAGSRSRSRRRDGRAGGGARFRCSHASESVTLERRFKGRLGTDPSDARRTRHGVPTPIFFEAARGIEPLYRALQALA
jgi:hypothetical protein